MNDAEMPDEMRLVSVGQSMTIASATMAKLLAIAGYDSMVAYCVMLAGRGEVVKIRTSYLIELLREVKAKTSRVLQ